ncbi:SLATT domain-containing protein [Vibrio parahaemolyticus]
MNEKERLKKDIADTAYNIIYGAKLNFSSYELSKNISTGVSAFSLAIGIIALAFVEFATKELSVALLLLGLLGLLVGKSPDSMVNLKNGAIKLTQYHDQLKILYSEVDSSSTTEDIQLRLEEIQNEARDFYSTDQLPFASWFAHHKLFNEHQSEWLCNALNLTFWKDKLPSTLKLLIKLILIIFFISIFHYSLDYLGAYDLLKIKLTDDC